MNKIEKLFKKLSRKERERLLAVVRALISGERRGLGIVKVKGTDFFRLRKGDFRIIFHYDSSGEVVIDSIKLRDKDTYKDLD